MWSVVKLKIARDARVKYQVRGVGDFHKVHFALEVSSGWQKKKTASESWEQHPSGSNGSLNSILEEEQLEVDPSWFDFLQMCLIIMDPLAMLLVSSLLAFCEFRYPNTLGLNKFWTGHHRPRLVGISQRTTRSTRVCTPVHLSKGEASPPAALPPRGPISSASGSLPRPLQTHLALEMKSRHMQTLLRGTWRFQYRIIELEDSNTVLAY